MTEPSPKHTLKRLDVYEILYTLNRGFEQVLGDLVRLQRFPFFRNGQLRGVQVLVEEARAWANFELLGIMQGREQNDWTRFGRLRRKWETRYRDPDDIPGAKELRRRQGKRGARGGKGASHV